MRRTWPETFSCGCWRRFGGRRETNGYRTEIWTTKRIAELIAREWRVRYHPDHIGRLMAKLGWTHQKPARRAAERDEEAIRRWVSEEWPRVKKTPRGGVPISPS